MPHSVFRVLSALAEFVSRLFPIRKDESTVLEESGQPYRSESQPNSTDGGISN
ncbi:MAG: hypothetical protein WBN35_08970 [Acidimicrobiia bacterium]|jgi:hypothetical protein